MSALESLCVIDRLEVGPVRLEKKRVVTPYTVYRGEQRESTELIYRYDEPVFDPEDPASLNLASMVTAQVALVLVPESLEGLAGGLFEGLALRFGRGQRLRLARDAAEGRGLGRGRVQFRQPLLHLGGEAVEVLFVEGSVHGE